MPGKLIVFSGLDGAGKSTQIGLLCRRLNVESIPHVTYWSRGGYTRGMETVKALVRRLTGRRLIPPPGDNPLRTKQLGTPWKRRWWLRLAILDLGALYAVWFRWQMLCGKYVLADRYWQDTLLDFQINFPDDDVESWWLWKVFLRSIPKPDHAFLMTVPVDVSVRRGAEKQEPFPTPPEQLHDRAQHYATWLGQKCKEQGTVTRWHWLDGTLDRQSVAADIWKQITSADHRSTEASIEIEHDHKPV